MSITDELRTVAAETEGANGRCEKLYRGDLDHIADRIDAELSERYVELPLDADGVPIHVGDELEGYGRTIEVVELRYGRSGWVVISRDGNAYADNHAFAHHTPDTWERIIRDAMAYAELPTDVDMQLLVARCRALAGDA